MLLKLHKCLVLFLSRILAYFKVLCGGEMKACRIYYLVLHVLGKSSTSLHEGILRLSEPVTDGIEAR